MVFDVREELFTDFDTVAANDTAFSKLLYANEERRLWEALLRLLELLFCFGSSRRELRVLFASFGLALSCDPRFVFFDLRTERRFFVPLSDLLSSLFFDRITVREFPVVVVACVLETGATILFNELPEGEFVCAGRWIVLSVRLSPRRSQSRFSWSGESS